jgi:parafibromin
MSTGLPYTLLTLWFLMKHAEKTHPQYLAECQVTKFPFVGLFDRQNLIDYFLGKTDQLQGVTAAKRSAVAAARTLPTKKPRTERLRDMQLDEGLEASKRAFVQRLQATAKTANATEADMRSGRVARAEDNLAADVHTLSSAEKAFVDADQLITEGIVRRERTFADRNSVLLSRGRDFADIVQTMKDALKATKLRKTMQAHGARRSSASTSSASASSGTKRTSGYDRYNQYRSEQEFWSKRLNTDGSSFTIDTHGSMAAGVVGAGSSSSSSSAVLSSASGSATPSSTSSSTSSSSSGSSSSASSRRGAKQQNRRSTAGKPVSTTMPALPIIVVPNSVTALINMYNVRDFLIEGKFVAPMDKKRAGARKAAVITVERRGPKGDTQRYEIIENPATLTKKEDWRRIVAVFAQGPTWQFKGWKWNKPVHIFSYGTSVG